MHQLVFLLSIVPTGLRTGFLLFSDENLKCYVWGYQWWPNYTAGCFASYHYLRELISGDYETLAKLGIAPPCNYVVRCHQLDSKMPAIICRFVGLGWGGRGCFATICKQMLVNRTRFWHFTSAYVLLLSSNGLGECMYHSVAICRYH